MGGTIRAATCAIAAALALAAPAAAQLPPLPTPPPLPPVPTVPPLPPVVTTPPDPQPYQANDGRGFHDVLPSGTAGLYNVADLAAFVATGRTVPHCCEQLGMYAGLMYGTPGLQAGDIPKYFKDSSFGVRAGDIERRYSPRGDVTIVRDKGFGVPHVYGRNRDGAMFGLGYAAAVDRLFFMDALRNAGRGQLSLVGGIFGKGGGEEIAWTQIRHALYARFKRKRAKKVFRDFRAAEDPEAPTTILGRKRFPYQGPPRTLARGSRAIYNRGSLREHKVVAASSGGAAAARAGAKGVLDGLLAFPKAASNAMLVSARESASGRPMMVAGPQVAYFNPQILMEEDVHAPAVAGKPGIDARGASFIGLNLYVQLGRGRDYAWSATSAGQDLIDTYALELCRDDRHYRYQMGWYGYVRKDLRTVLGRKVRSRYARKYCGGGPLRRCRQVLRRSLRDAIRAARGDVYGGDKACAEAKRAGDQWCFDAVRQRPVGGATQPLIPWINRPTYQQVTEIQGAAPR